MSFPKNITAVQFSRFAVSNTTTSVVNFTTKAQWGGIFSGVNNLIDMGNIRDMPSFGTPANIIKIPVYGRDQTLSVGAQPDAPDLEFTINYVGSEWDADGTTSSINSIKADGLTRPMMVQLLSSQAASSKIGSDAQAGIAAVPNGVIFFGGRVESALFNPMRDDAATVTVALSVQTDFFGPFTYDTVPYNIANADLYFLTTATATAPAQPGAASSPAGGWAVGATTNTLSSLSWTTARPYIWSIIGTGSGGSRTYSAPILAGLL